MRLEQMARPSSMQGVITYSIKHSFYLLNTYHRKINNRQKAGDSRATKAYKLYQTLWSVGTCTASDNTLCGRGSGHPRLGYLTYIICLIVYLPCSVSIELLHSYTYAVVVLLVSLMSHSTL